MKLSQNNWLEFTENYDNPLLNLETTDVLLEKLKNNALVLSEKEYSYSWLEQLEKYSLSEKAKNNIKIRLDLTKPRLNLLDQAKELITEDSCVDYVFADINCNVAARLKSNEFKFFNNLDFFKKNILKIE